MKKSYLKKVLSMILMACLLLGANVVSYAYDGGTESGTDFVSEEGRTLPFVPDDLAVTRSGQLSDMTYTTTSGANFGGNLTVPQSENGSLIKVFWRGVPQNGANSSAIFKLTISGNGQNKSIYLPANNSTDSYAIANLPAGTYRYTFSPYSNVSGSYQCFYQFWAY